jgi:hypothetical protein
MDEAMIDDQEMKLGWMRDICRRSNVNDLISGLRITRMRLMKLQEQPTQVEDSGSSAREGSRAILDFGILRGVLPQIVGVALASQSLGDCVAQSRTSCLCPTTPDVARVTTEAKAMKTPDIRSIVCLRLLPSP